MTVGIDRLNFDMALLDSACTRLGLRMLVLFGSHATGDPPPGPDSDVDLAVSFTDRHRNPSVWDAQRELSPIFGAHTLDVVFLRDADPLFRWEIVKEGNLLWGDAIDFLNYRAFAFRDFIDSADLRRLERTLFEKKMNFIRKRLNAAA